MMECYKWWRETVNSGTWKQWVAQRTPPQKPFFYTAFGRRRKCLNTFTNLNRQKEGELFPLESIMHCKSKKPSGKHSRRATTDERQTKRNSTNCCSKKKKKKKVKFWCVRSLFPGHWIFLQKGKRKRHVGLVSVCLSSSNVCPKDNQESLVYAVIRL